MLAAGGLNGTVSIFDLEKGELVVLLKGHTGGIRTLAFAEDGRTLISRSEDGVVKIWKVGNEQ